ncbi:hypothetical protein DFS34DRAFT_319405 [Phlyctochytrium arcticum]|nr:hypothetical protein DFS34DRAFT_319405 [Phlyctochytrium arcticum]
MVSVKPPVLFSGHEDLRYRLVLSVILNTPISFTGIHCSDRDTHAGLTPEELDYINLICTMTESEYTLDRSDTALHFRPRPPVAISLDWTCEASIEYYLEPLLILAVFYPMDVRLFGVSEGYTTACSIDTMREIHLPILKLFGVSDDALPDITCEARRDFDAGKGCISLVARPSPGKTLQAFDFASNDGIFEHVTAIWFAAVGTKKPSWDEGSPRSLKSGCSVYDEEEKGVPDCDATLLRLLKRTIPAGQDSPVIKVSTCPYKSTGDVLTLIARGSSSAFVSVTCGYHPKNTHAFGASTQGKEHLAVRAVRLLAVEAKKSTGLTGPIQAFALTLLLLSEGEGSIVLDNATTHLLPTVTTFKLLRQVRTSIRSVKEGTRQIRRLYYEGFGVRST